MMLAITLLPLLFLLITFLLPDRTPTLRNRWLLAIAPLILLSITFNALAWWPHPESISDPVAALQESMRLSHQNLMFSLAGISFGTTAFIIFLLRCRRAVA